MNHKIITTITVGVCFSSLTVHAANRVADGRGNGMGNTGVTSANYLLAPFYNPALTAVYNGDDDFGLLLPAIGARVSDSDKSLETIDDLQDTINDFENNPTIANEAQLNAYLDQLDGNKPLAVAGGVAVAVAIPLDLLSVNVFSSGYAEVLAQPVIFESNDTTTRYENSTVDTLAFAYSEVGVALAKQLTLFGLPMSLGVSPKFQELETYKQEISIRDFDVSDYDQTKTSKSAFNMDLGAVWFYHNFRAGLAVKDLFYQDIDTQDVGGVDKYELDTQVTVSGAYATEVITASVDWDLTKQGRFVNREDDTRYLRFGLEGNAFGWFQARLGYEFELEDTLDDTFTAGVGFSPGDLFHFDLAGSYAGSNQFGLSGNLAFTF